MPKVSTYLNFPRQTEEVFNFYKTVFGGEFMSVNRFGEIPPMEGMPPLAETDKDLIMHIALPILDGHLLMGTDAPESMGFKINSGNNVYIFVHLDSREETDKYFKALSEGGTIEQPLQDQFWGDYYGSLKDKYGVQWMLAYAKKK